MAYEITPLDSALEFDTTQAFEKDSQWLSATRFVIVWRRSGSLILAQAFDLTPSTGAITALSSAATIYSGTNSTCPKLVVYDSTHFVVFWGGDSADGYVRSFQVNAGTGAITTWGSEVEYDTSNGTYPSPVFMDATHILNVWAGASNGLAQIFTLNSGTGAITQEGSPYSYTAGPGTFTSILKISATKAAVFYAGTDSDGYGIVLDVNTSTWAVTAAGSEFEYLDGVTIQNNTIVALSNPTVILNLAVSSGGAITGSFFRPLSIDTSTWAITNLGSTETVFALVSGNLATPCVKLDATHVWIGVQGTDNDGFVQTWSIDLTTGAMAKIDEEEIDPNDGFAMSALNYGSGLIVNSYSGTDLDGFVRAYQVAMPPTATGGFFTAASN